MERQGWRCEVISRWHRDRLGHDDYAVDLDFVLVEHATHAGLPAAIIEYKHEGASEPNVDHCNYKALSRLATASAVPAMIVKYGNLLNHWEVTPLNNIAKLALQKLNGGARIFDEAGYIRFLRRLRQRVIQRYRSSSAV